MAIYYQHVGKDNAERDFPETIGKENELKKFKLEDIEKHLIDLNLVEIPEIRDKIARLAPDGFQIWGIPSGAENVLKSMQTDDHLMLMPSKNFRYCGKVIHKFEGLNHELSLSLWGESKFAIIILLRGNWISYPWIEFREKFGFDANYHMRGNTQRLADKRLADSSFQTEAAFISHILPNLHSPPLSDHITKFSIEDFSLPRLKPKDFIKPQKIIDDDGKTMIQSRLRAARRGSHVVIWVLSKGGKNPVDYEMERGRKKAVQRMKERGMMISVITTANEGDKVRESDWKPTAEETVVCPGPVNIPDDVETWCNELWRTAQGVASKGKNNPDRPLHFYIRSELEPEEILKSIIEPPRNRAYVNPNQEKEVSESVAPKQNSGWTAEVFVTEALRNHGWDAKLVGHLHQGFDIKAKKEGRVLLVEVKSSVNKANPSFTHNEFNTWRDHKEEYIVAIMEDFDPQNTESMSEEDIEWIKIRDGNFDQFKVEEVKSFRLNRTVWKKLICNTKDLEL